jgi:hypothetical protein
MSLLREIQDDLSRQDGDVTNALRKCEILSARLGSEEFGRWVDWELNGYPDGQKTPSYRILPASWFGNFMGGGWSCSDQPIPDFLFPENVRKGIREIEFREGIAKAISLAKGALIHDPEAAAIISNSPAAQMKCVGAWRVISGNDFEQMISAVKNRILDFVLKIEAENPAAGDVPLHTQPIPKGKLDSIVNNNFFGAVGNIAQGGHGFTQNATISYQKSELEKFVQEFSAHLGELPLDSNQRRKAEAQLGTLQAQLTDEPDPIIVRQAVNSLRNITEGAIGSLIATVATQPGVWHWISHVMSSLSALAQNS